MTQNSFDLDIMYGRNYLKSDNVQTVVIHRVNLNQTQVHALYGQAKTKDKKFLPPVKVSVMVDVEDGK